MEKLHAQHLDKLTYFGAKYLGQAGQNLYLAALFLVAARGPSASLGLSSLFVAILVPAIIFGLPAGALVDKIGAARGYLVGTVLRLLSIGLGLAILPAHPELAWLIAFIYSAGSQVFTPAEMAMVPAVQANAAGRAHSILIGLQYAGQGTGMIVLAPALFLLGGPVLMLSGAVVAYAAVTVAALFLDTRLRGTVAGLRIPARRAFAFRETFAYFNRERLAGYAVALQGFKAVGGKCMVIALPFYIERDLGLPPAALAYLVVPCVVGVCAGLVWAGRSARMDSAASMMRLAFLGLIVCALAAASLDYGLTAAAQYSQVPPIARLEASLNTGFVVALPVAFLLGLCFSAALVTSRMVMTETAPAGQQARVFATQMTLTDAVILLPLVMAGVGVEFAGARATLAVVGALGLGLFVLMELMVAGYAAAGARSALERRAAAPVRA